MKWSGSRGKAAETEAQAPPDLWIPLEIDPNSNSQVEYFLALARLKPGITGHPGAIPRSKHVLLHAESYSGLEASQRQEIFDLAVAIGIDFEGNAEIGRRLGLRFGGQALRSRPLHTDSRRA